VNFSSPLQLRPCLPPPASETLRCLPEFTFCVMVTTFQATEAAQAKRGGRQGENIGTGERCWFGPRFVHVLFM